VREGGLHLSDADWLCRSTITASYEIIIIIVITTTTLTINTPPTSHESEGAATETNKLRDGDPVRLDHLTHAHTHNTHAHAIKEPSTATTTDLS
jgi:hypothetical protein